MRREKLQRFILEPANTSSACSEDEQAPRRESELKIPRQLVARSLIFILLLVLLPTQLGLHFWPEWAVINGIRVDYFSPTLYATDILILLLLFLEIPKIRLGNLERLGILGILVVMNIYFSLSPAVSIYKWIKVAEFGFLVFWISKKNLSYLSAFLPLLLIPVLYESILAIWQFVSQSSIGGLWYFLGERTFNGGTPGIANAYINGQLVLRPYGTFPHPNVLGGFLAVILPLVLARFLHNSRRINVSGILGKLGIFGMLSLGYLTLFLSMSRAAILVGLGATLLVSRRKILWVLILIVPLFLLLPRFVTADTEPLIVREQLNSLAWREFTSSPLWGTGLGTSPIYNSKFKILNYALAHQPTHNIYLLVLAETGVWGLGLIGLLGILAIKRRSIPLLSILILGLVDHYFLTLQQGQLLLVVVLGATMAWSNQKGKKGYNC